MTLRALKKLCFGVFSSFLKEIKKELPEYNNISGILSFKNKKGDINEEKLVTFYQKILKTNYANRVLDINFEGLQKNVLNNNIPSENEFQSSLEKYCYRKDIIFIDDKIKSELLNLDKSCLFELSSYDLSLLDKGKSEKIKKHTQLWKKLWEPTNKTAGYPVRLNPEVSVFYRNLKKDKLKFFKPNLGRKNRFAQPHWHLKTTLTLNATAERMDLSFKHPENIKKQIIQFNKIFFQSLKNQSVYCYGLDRGFKELASLCIIKKDLYNNKGSSSFVPFPVYRLKEEYYETRAVKNMSYFIDHKKDWFEKEEKPTLDLTTAKLINGKIIENGDIFTYLKLKELSAKRKLFEYRQEIITPNKIYYSKAEQCFKINTLNRGKKEPLSIYYYRQAFEKILPVEDIQNMLQKYLDVLKQEPPIEQINHLRKAVTANMVGILAFIHPQAPKLIVLEDNQKHRNNGENIAGHLEWALYRKFQTEGLVPPRLKEPDFLLKLLKKQKESPQISGFGLIQFISPDETSKKCPNCDEIGKNHEQFKKEKQDGWFHCRKCDFNTKNPSPDLKFLNSPDKMAAYNIAQKITFSAQNDKMQINR